MLYFYPTIITPYFQMTPADTISTRTTYVRECIKLLSNDLYSNDVYISTSAFRIVSKLLEDNRIVWDEDKEIKAYIEQYLLFMS